MKLRAVLKYCFELGGHDRTALVEDGEILLDTNIGGSGSVKHQYVQASARDVVRGFEAVANFINQKTPGLKLEVKSQLVFTSQYEL